MNYLEPLLLHHSSSLQSLSLPLMIMTMNMQFQQSKQINKLIIHLRTTLCVTEHLIIKSEMLLGKF